MSYRLSEVADDDLLRILSDGIDRFGVAQALKYRVELERVFELLGRHPEMARLRRDLARPARVHPHGVHIIVYDIVEHDEVLIQRIRHGREDWINARS